MVFVLAVWPEKWLKYWLVVLLLCEDFGLDELEAVWEEDRLPQIPAAMAWDWCSMIGVWFFIFTLIMLDVDFGDVLQSVMDSGLRV